MAAATDAPQPKPVYRVDADGQPIPPRPPGGMVRHDEDFETLEQRRARMLEEMEQRYAAGDGDRHDEAIASILADAEAKKNHYYPESGGPTGQDVTPADFEEFFDRSIQGAAYASGEVVKADANRDSIHTRNASVYRQAFEQAFNGNVATESTEERQARLVANELRLRTADTIADNILGSEAPTPQERADLEAELNDPDLQWLDEQDNENPGGW